MSELVLNLVERRVLGVLLEKSLAQPEYYPMTLNAIVAACNQRNNRDPVMELDEDAVWHTLDQLRQAGLVAKVLPAQGSRVDRFKHDVDTKLGWPKPQKALMAELLLRGPQTVGELRTRASRMYAFDNIEAVSAVIEWLSAQSPPLVAPMPRGAGQSAVRFAHRLYPPDEAPPAETARTSSPGGFAPPAAAAASSRESDAPSSALLEQLEGLQTEIAELHEAVADLRRRLDRLEGR